MNNYIELNNNIKIPRIGLGTWQITDKDIMSDIVKNAFDTGYRMFDTAAAYTNERILGKAIENLNIQRNEVFISDKVWNTYRGKNKVVEACQNSLKKLKLEYIDLYMIHWPASKKLYDNWEEINASTWEGMEEVYNMGLVKAIGVCNFKKHHLEALKKTAKIMPMVNQFEYHPGINHNELIEFCKLEHIATEASSPLGNGQILGNPIIQDIATKHNKTIAQICLRWSVQKGFIVIPKTTNKNRAVENYNIFDFELTNNEMEQINKIPYCGGIGIDSDEVVEFG